jgi:hypothetical protein
MYRLALPVPSVNACLECGITIPSIHACIKGADRIYAFHYVHDFCRFNMEVNTFQTDVDKSISYAEAKADKEKVLELHKQVL